MFQRLKYSVKCNACYRVFNSKIIVNRSRLVYCAALLLEAVAFHRQVLFYPGHLFPWDFRTVHLPLATFAADSFRHGEFPLWDPYTYCGYPIYANIQAAFFYPPVLAATLAGAWLGDAFLPRLLAIAVVAQIVFAGICTYTLLRRLGARSAAAWIAGTMYELGCFFASQGEHMGAMQAASWLPLVWLCVVELRAGVRWGWVGALAGALAMSVLAGLPQVAVAAFASAFALAVIVCLFRAGRWVALVPVLIGGAWGLVLAAIQFIPSAELVQNSVAKYRSEWLQSGGGIHPGALVSLILPNYWSVFDLSKFHGPGDLTFLYLYSSLLGLALAIAAVVWRPDLWSRVFAVLTALATIAMLGDTTPVGRVFLALLPVNVRIGIHPEFFFCAFSLGLAVLAGLGAERLLRVMRWRVIAGVIIACDLLLVSSGHPMNSVSTADEPGFTADSADGSREIIQKLRELTGSTMPSSRFDTLPGVSFAWVNSAPIFRIPTAGGCDPLALERIIQVRLAFSPGERWGTCYSVVHPEAPAVGLVNDRILIAPAGKPVTGMGHVASIAGYDLYENPQVQPRFSIPNGRVDVVTYGPTYVRVIAHTPAVAELLVTDSFYPGWDAQIDGHATPILLRQTAFRGVAVPAGDHTVELTFVPRVLYRSAALTGIGVVFEILVLASVWRRRQKA